MRILECMRDRNDRLLVLAAAAVMSGAVLVAISGCGGGTSGTGVGTTSFERVRGTVITEGGATLTQFEFTVAGSDTTVMTDDNGTFETEIECRAPSAVGQTDGSGAVDQGAVVNGGSTSGPEATEGVAVIITDPAPSTDPAADSTAGQPAAAQQANEPRDNKPIPIEPGIGDGSSLPPDSGSGSGVDTPADQPTSTDATTVIVQVADPVADAAVTVEPSGTEPLAVAVDFSDVCTAAAAVDTGATVPADAPAEGPSGATIVMPGEGEALVPGEGTSQDETGSIVDPRL